MGIRLGRVAAGAWAVAGALAAIGGAFFTSFPAPGVSNATGLLALTRDPGRDPRRPRLDRRRGRRRADHRRRAARSPPATRTSCRSSAAGCANVIPYVVMLLVLLWRPSGLFGTRELDPCLKRPAIVVGARADRRVVALLARRSSSEAFWLQTGLFAMAAAIGAIGLTILIGITGQLSLAHAFFVARRRLRLLLPRRRERGPGRWRVRPRARPAAAAGDGPGRRARRAGGRAVQPDRGRLRGIYLGLASIGLVFIGQHILFNATGITGGFNGRDAEPFSLFGFQFSGANPDNFIVFGVPYGELERLWYLGLVLVALS